MTQRITFTPTAIEQRFINRYARIHDTQKAREVFLSVLEVIEKEELDTPPVARVGGSQYERTDATTGSNFRSSSTCFAVAAMLKVSKNEGDVL